jgi:lysozyme
MTIQPLLNTTLTSLSEADQLLCEHMVALNEGFRAQAYDDKTGLRVKAPVGALTIGNGINLDIGLSVQESMTILRNRLCQAECSILVAFPWFKGLTAIRKIAILDIVYNLGITDFKTFTTFIGKMEDGQYAAAADDVQTTLWDKEDGERAVRDDYMIRNNAWLKG